MSGRYDKIQLQKDTKGIRRMPTTLYPNIPFSPNDVYVRTTPGDRLDLLSYQFYGDVKYWWIIAHANNLGKGSMAVPEGSQVRIPANPIQIQAIFIEINKR